MYNLVMSPKTGHDEKNYELLRKRDFYSPFTFSDWQLNKNYMVMREKLRERKYTVKDTGISYRVINNWELSKLMPEGVNIGDRQKESNWRTFSLVEMAWLKVIAHLRNFGLSLKQIYTVKQHVISWNKKYGYYPAFEYSLAQALFSPKETYLRVLADGTADLLSFEEIEMEKIINGSKDMLLVSMKSILSDIGMDFPTIKSRLELSHEEYELVEEIRNRENNEVRAGVKDGEIREIETTRTTTDVLSDKNIRDFFKKNGTYGRATTQYEKGEQRSVQVVKRRRFGKK